MKHLSRCLMCLLWASVAACYSRPNVVIFLVDDLGNADVGAFGNQTLRTPNVDSICKKGVQLNHDLAGGATCCPSRAALLTGRYAQRSGMADVLMGLMEDRGLHRSEWTIPNMLQHEGYATALIGKWHMGWNKGVMDRHYHPKNFGFDHFFGLPYTVIKDFGGKQKITEETGLNRMVVNMLGIGIITSVVLWKFISVRLGIFCFLLSVFYFGGLYFTVSTLGISNSILIRNDRIIEMPIELTTITQRLINEGQEFIRTQHSEGKPVFLMMSWLHVHSYLHPQPPFKGSSLHGAYGDAVEETDWAIGQIMSTLRELDIEDQTFVFFSSDHGGDKHDLDENGKLVGGWNGIFKGGKGDGGQEGGVRVPTCIQWSDHLAAGSSIDQPTSHLDLLPTVAAISGGRIPKDRIYDGENILPILTGKRPRTRREFIFHYSSTTLSSVRYTPIDGSGVFKLHYTWPQWSPGKDTYPNMFTALVSPPNTLQQPLLFKISDDPREDHPLDTSAQPFSNIVQKITSATKAHKETLLGVPNEKRSRLMILSKFWRWPFWEYLWQTFQEKNQS